MCGIFVSCDKIKFCYLRRKTKFQLVKPVVPYFLHVITAIYMYFISLLLILKLSFNRYAFKATNLIVAHILITEVSRVQQLVSALQRQRQELSRAVRHLTQQSHALQTTQVQDMTGKLYFNKDTCTDNAPLR